MQIVVDKLLVNYELSGKGKLVLLLHGWGDSIQGIKGLAKTLSEDYRILSLDLPGFGSTQAPSGIWNLDDYGKFLQSFLKKLDLDQPYAVVGHSNGGALAIRSVSQGWLKPQRLILLAASGIRAGRSFKRLLLKILAKTGNVATLWMPERYRNDLRKSLYGAAGSDMLVMPDLKETFKRTVRQDVQGDAVNIETPTLLIYASDDKAVSPEDGRQYQKLIEGSKLEIIEDAGHFVHLDRPDKVSRLIEDFLK